MTGSVKTDSHHYEELQPHEIVKNSFNYCPENNILEGKRLLCNLDYSLDNKALVGEDLKSVCAKNKRSGGLKFTCRQCKHFITTSHLGKYSWDLEYSQVVERAAEIVNSSTAR